MHHSLDVESDIGHWTHQRETHGMGGMETWHGTYFILVYTNSQHFRQILLHQSGGIFTCQKCSKMFCCRSFEFKQQAVTSKKLAIYWINLNFGLNLTSPNTLTWAQNTVFYNKIVETIIDWWSFLNGCKCANHYLKCQNIQKLWLLVCLTLLIV